MTNSERMHLSGEMVYDEFDLINQFRKQLYETFINIIELIWNGQLLECFKYGHSIITSEMKEVIIQGQQQLPATMIGVLIVEVRQRILLEYSSCPCGNGEIWRNCDCGAALQPIIIRNDKSHEQF